MDHLKRMEYLAGVRDRDSLTESFELANDDASEAKAALQKLYGFLKVHDGDRRWREEYKTIRQFIDQNLGDASNEDFDLGDEASVALEEIYLRLQEHDGQGAGHKEYNTIRQFIDQNLGDESYEGLQSSDQVVSEDVNDVVEELEDVAAQIRDLLDHAMSLTPQHLKARSRSYWYNQMLGSLGSDEIMGGSMYSLQELINDVREDDPDDY